MLKATVPYSDISDPIFFLIGQNGIEFRLNDEHKRPEKNAESDEN